MLNIVSFHFFRNTATSVNFLKENSWPEVELWGCKLLTFLESNNSWKSAFDEKQGQDLEGMWLPSVYAPGFQEHILCSHVTWEWQEEL